MQATSQTRRAWQRQMIGGNAIQLKWDTRTEDFGGEHVLPVVPVVRHPRDRHHGREQQRQEDDAELGHMAAPVERLHLAGQVPRQEA